MGQLLTVFRFKKSVGCAVPTGRRASFALVLPVLLGLAGCSMPASLFHPKAVAAIKAKRERDEARRAVRPPETAGEVPQPAQAPPPAAMPSIQAQKTNPGPVVATQGSSSALMAPTPVPAPGPLAPPAPAPAQIPVQAGAVTTGGGAPADNLAAPSSPRKIDLQPPTAIAPAPATAAAPATNSAVIAFTLVPNEDCEACEKVKITVTQAGSVLIERGHWRNGRASWRYKDPVETHVDPAKAAAFAAALQADRPTGRRVLEASPACQNPASRDGGIVIEWIEFGRDDMLTVNFDCSIPRDSLLGQRLLRLPDLLGSRKISF